MDTGKPAWWQQAVNVLSKDELLGEVVQSYPGESPCWERRSVLYFDSLNCRTTNIGPWPPMPCMGTTCLVGWRDYSDFMKFSAKKNRFMWTLQTKGVYIHGLARESSDLILEDWSAHSGC